MNPHRAHYSSNQMFDNLKATQEVPANLTRWNKWVKIATAVATVSVGYYWMFRKDFGERDHVFIPLHRWHDKLITSLGFSAPNRTSAHELSFGIFGKQTRVPNNDSSVSSDVSSDVSSSSVSSPVSVSNSGENAPTSSN